MSDTPKFQATGPAEANPGPEAIPATGGRRPLVIGNWKMNGDAGANAKLLAALLSRIDRALLDRVDVAVCPPFPFIAQVAERLADSGLQWGAQNVARQDNGAFTGEVSARMLADLRCSWVLIGHSERRQLFGETDESVADKVAQAFARALSPVVCLGETLEERRAGVTEEVLARQLDAAMPALLKGSGRYALAYEPVWAIGTGLTATPAQAQSAHAFLRRRLADAGAGDADQVRILYGGSLKPVNAAELLEQEDVDGGLIGGAALVAEDFVAICNAAAAALSGQRRAPGESTDG
ncbi:MAG TPA: triose-phosphate isomerase [Lautropia sp.]|jgi:triosephosphate isomerase|nr:triose-phosphate isomerase [Lautropia sp.]